MLNYKTTAEIKIPPRLIDQVIGQDKAVDIIKKAAKQRRHVLMIGPPGTGKSMLAQAMAELMPAEELEDVLVYPNPNDENKPLIRVVPTYPKEHQLAKYPELVAFYQQIKKMGFLKNQNIEQLPGAGRLIYQAAKNASNLTLTKPQSKNTNLMFLVGLMVILAVMYALGYLNDANKWFVLGVLGAFGLFYLIWRFIDTLSKRMGFMAEHNEPKLIVDNTGRLTAPFIDATGNKAGALLGDVKHDPLQSGGLGTPAHLRVEAGAIHKANKGVLFIDEIASLKMRWQQEILTAMQEKKYPITGQSELSSGAIVKTEPVPCDFVLVAAGNYMDLRHMHPAIRSRIRGSGYEVYMEETMEDNQENRDKLVQFVAQEVVKDKKIPHFDKEAVEEIIAEARRKAGRKNRLTLNLRELGGLVRAAGDIAREENSPITTAEHVRKAKKLALTMEQQIASKYIEIKKEYEVFSSKGYEIGKVNGLAVLGDSLSGLVLPIVAEVTPAASKNEGKVIATGKLGSIAKEAVENVSALIKKHLGKNVSLYDIHIQFLQTYEGVEGDSAAISIAVAVLSAMEDIPIRQDLAMTGSLSVRGDVLPIGGATAKTEAAIEAGIKEIIVPEKNISDIYLTPKNKDKIKITPVKTILDVLKIALKDCPKKEKLIEKIKKIK